MKQPENHKYFSYDLEDIDNISILISNCIQYDNIKFDGFVFIKRSLNFKW